MKRRWGALPLVVCLVSSASGQDPASDVVTMRVADIGAGLACVLKIPSGNAVDPWFHLVYDAGDFVTKAREETMRQIAALVGDDTTIDCLVLSHTDADHNGAVPEICSTYHVRSIVHSGYVPPSPSATLQRANAAIAQEVAQDGAQETNLHKLQGYFNGQFMTVGQTRVTFVAGFDVPPQEFGTQGESEFKNAGSIVLRVTHDKRSILLTGDAVGRHIGDPADALIATERYMVENLDVVPLRSDVLLAPHHGADNGSSTAFIEAVKPVWVIFSAGHKHEHPRFSTFQRYRAFGVPETQMLRTDRGDDEQGDGDWPSSVQGGDALGRDTIEVKLTPRPGSQPAEVTVTQTSP